MSLAIYWPPSDASAPFFIATILGLWTTIWLLFGTKKENKHQEKSREEKLKRVKQGLELMAIDETNKDKAHAKKNGTRRRHEKKNGTERTTGLPEATRIFGYLWDEVEEAPASALGIAKDDVNLLTCRALLDRSLRAELGKAKELSEASQRIDELDDAWFDEHGTKHAEVLGHTSGEKLEKVLKMEERVRKALGRSVLSKKTQALVKDSSRLLRKLRAPNSAALRAVAGMVLQVAPLWLFALLVGFIGPIMWVEVRMSTRMLTHMSIHMSKHMSTRSLTRSSCHLTR